MMKNVRKWLLACKAAFIAVGRLPPNDSIIASKGAYFKIPKDKITFVYTHASGISVFELTVRQTRKIVSLINDACDANESRTVKVDLMEWTVDARLRGGRGDQIRMTINDHENWKYLGQIVVDRDGFRMAANKISERIGLFPDSSE